MRWNKTVVPLAEAEDISWTYFLLNGAWDPATDTFDNDSLWDEEADRWNQPVLDAFAEARAEPIESWANCSGDPTPTTATTTPPTAPTPAGSAASPATPVEATPQFTG